MSDAVETAPRAGPGTDLTGAWAGQYLLTGLIGAGGLSSVWVGENRTVGARVAIKVLQAEIFQADQALRRYEVESQAASRINSPHIAKTFEFGVLESGHRFAVNELLEGETLATRVARRGPLTWDELRPVALQAITALVSAHDAGIAHRNLKPENIHLGPAEEQPTVKLLDFGIARFFEEALAHAAEHQPDAEITAVIYAAPEQVAGRPVAQPADIYSLGALLYEALAGEPPFSGTARHVTNCKLSRRPARLTSLAPDVPPVVAGLIDGMLARAPRQRPSARDVLTVLMSPPAGAPGPETASDVAAGAARGSRGASGPQPLATPAGPPTPSRRASTETRILQSRAVLTLLALLTAMILSAAVAMALLAIPSQQEATPERPAIHDQRE